MSDPISGSGNPCPPVMTIPIIQVDSIGMADADKHVTSVVSNARQKISLAPKHSLSDWQRLMHAAIVRVSARFIGGFEQADMYYLYPR